MCNALHIMSRRHGLDNVRWARSGTALAAQSRAIDPTDHFVRLAVTKLLPESMIGPGSPICYLPWSPCFLSSPIESNSTSKIKVWPGPISPAPRSP